jgi:AAA+ superfamily predicted ATPase
MIDAPLNEGVHWRCGKTSMTAKSGIRLRLSFRKTSSFNYQKAVSLAAKLPSYKCVGKEGQKEHSVYEPLLLNRTVAWKTIKELVRTVRGWKTADLRLENYRNDRSVYRLFQYEMDEVESCFRRRQESQREDDYCTGKISPTSEPGYFGCKLERGVSLGTGLYFQNKPAPWYKFGRLSAGNKVFHIDKAAILKELKAKTGKNMCIACPALKWGRFHLSIKELPSTINVEGSVYQLTRSAINNKPLGIEPEEESGRFGLNIGLNLGKSDSGQEEVRRIPDVKYEDVAGQEKAISAIKDVVQLPLTHEKYFLETGVESHKGILLYGLPGNGKTLLAKAVATESKAHLEIINGPEILSMWVGASAKNLRGIFERARRLAPSVILIDEIDAIAPSREKMAHQHDVSLISQLLVLLDGLEERGRIIVIGTTNRPQEVDVAIRRPGRLDYAIEVSAPTQEAREAILRVHARKMKLSPDVNFRYLSRIMDGFSGADIAAFCREAGMIAIKRAISKGQSPQRLKVSPTDFQSAMVAMSEKRIQA